MKKENNIKKIVGLIMVPIFYLSVIIMVLAQISGIGYGLYLWGGLGMEFGSSVWSGFLLWLKMMVSGFFLFMISFGFLS